MRSSTTSTGIAGSASIRKPAGISRLHSNLLSRGLLATARTSQFDQGGVGMKLTGTALAALILCGLMASAQEFTTTTIQKIESHMTDGKQVEVTGCVERVEGLYVLTKGGSLVYVFVTAHYLTNFVGRIVEVKGLATTSTTSSTTTAAGDIEKPVLLMQSIKTLAYSCR